MKALLLVRHAKSSWKNAESTDRNRPLNDRGKRDAPYMGKLLSERGVKPDVLISSPADRALTTARFMAREMKYRAADIVISESLYMGTLEDMLDLVQRSDGAHRTVMVVSHNPAITLFSNFLSGDNIEKIPTCGIVFLEFDTNDWKDIDRGSGRVKFYEYPKKHFR